MKFGKREVIGLISLVILAVGEYCLQLQYWFVACLFTLIALCVIGGRYLWLSQLLGKFKAVRVVSIYVLSILMIFLFTGFIGSAYEIPSDSMSPTVIQGDYLWCNKLAYGTVVRGDIFQSFLKLIFHPSRIYFRNPELNYSRVFCTSQIRRSDIVIFKSPERNDESMVKRIVGLPGETVEMRRGMVYINSTLVKPILGEAADTCDLTAIQIPYRGMTIHLNKTSLQKFRQVMEVYEGFHISLLQDTSKIACTYTFRQDYYFALGDNRPNSRDSRSWGFVPEDYIIGRAEAVLFSTAKLNRVLRLIQ
ncbi:signal peptidase I [Dinghuibacter silviterrae]|nr:signal peptidase I [Dinghuibacter silviterrae]